MKNLLRLSLFTLTAIALSACHEGYDSVPDHHDSTPPELYSFELTDSFGHSSFYGESLHIDPYFNSGFFQLDWDVESYQPYLVELRINDTPSPFGGKLISSNFCGYGYSCDNIASQQCYYSSDFDIECYQPDASYLDSVTNISEFIYDIPEKLYLILEVCDTDALYCEYDSRPVTLY